MMFHTSMSNMMIYWYIMVYARNILAHKFTNISAESIASEKQNFTNKKRNSGNL